MTIRWHQAIGNIEARGLDQPRRIQIVLQAADTVVPLQRERLGNRA